MPGLYAACIFVINDGIGMAFGVLVPHVQDRFSSSFASATFVGSLHIGMSYICSPVAVWIVSAASSYRKVGATIVTASLALSPLCKSIEHLTICYGLVAGCAISMVSIPALVILNKYFDKKRALANAIFYSGSSFGYFSSTPMLSSILTEYGLSAYFLRLVWLQLPFLLSHSSRNLTVTKKTPTRVKVGQQKKRLKGSSIT